MKRVRRIKVKPRLEKWRINFILFILILIFVCLSFVVTYIKKVHGEEYESAAKLQQVDDGRIIPPNRGSIVDRDKQAIAVSTTVFNVALDPLVLVKYEKEEQERTFTVLSEKLGVDYNEIKSYLTLETHWKYIAKKIDRTLKEEIEAEKLKGVVFEKDTKRKYTFGTLAAQVVGFIRGDSLWGLESQYNEYMEGSPGRSFKSYNSNGEVVTQEIFAKDGSTIVTTIDSVLQQYAEEAVTEAQKAYTPEMAAAMIMNPNTGEVYAMAASNMFDANNPAEPLALSDPQFTSVWEAYTEDERYEYLNNTWKNFNIASTYEPGSIFKPITVAAALEENIIAKDEGFFCPGNKTVYDRSINCHLRTGHGNISLKDSLAQSCNVAMMDIAAKMGVNLFYKYQKDFGFGERTGIDLPGEVSASSASGLMFEEDEIGPVELATMSFGQSFNCTTVQALTALSAIINGGNLMKPYVVSQVIDTDGNIIKENKPEVVRKVISQDTSDTVRTFLRETMITGTGKKANVDLKAYSIGGKTGTAQQGKREDELYTLSFMSYFPVENPQYILLCIIHRPHPYVDGITSPAPMMNGLLKKIIKYKNIEPSYTEENAVNSSSESESTVILGNYIGGNLPEAIDDIEKKNLLYEVVGSGNTITNQTPKENTEVKEGSSILLYVEKGENDAGTTIVPNVIGMPYTEAVTVLIDAGFVPLSNDSEEGYVVSQSPKGGISVKPNTEINIKVEKLSNENNNNENKQE